MLNQANQTEVMKNKLLRGQILKTLTLFYPSPVNVNSLKTALMTRGVMATADITKTLHYLKDKQYIRITEGRIQEIEDDDLVELTAKGVDLMEGTIEDPGVEI